MANHTTIITKKTERIPAENLLRSILEELRLLRNEVALLFPTEDLKEYAHPARIKRSYEKALKQYPPATA